MTAYEVATLLGTRVEERERPDPGLTGLTALRGRAQVVRLGNRLPLSSLASGHVYIAAKGVVGIEAGTPDSDVSVITSLLYPGDILVPDLQAPLPALALVSQRPTEFWKLTASVFSEEARAEHQCWQTIFRRLNEQIARAQLHAAAVSTLNCEERVAAFLIEAALRVGSSSGGQIAFELPLSRYGIADYFSLNADTVSRTFSAFVAATIIERRGRYRVLVRDWQALIDRCPMADAFLRMHGNAKLIR